MHEDNETWTVVVDADTSPLERELVSAARFGRQFSSMLGQAFDGIAVKGRGLGDVLRSLALSLSRMAFQAAFKPLEQGFSALFAGLLGGAVPFARGGVVANSLPVPFASGGVVRSPIAFPLDRGRMGIAGERGAEAIMPLSRGPDGRLGIRAERTGGPAIVFQISTPDVESFRRSETQIAAMLARAVALGQRNL